jgi:2-succinyl-6-hydroxy-2,4-cyclohexadiene-1-carboxylate synthase
MTTTIALHGFLGLPSDWDKWNCIPYCIEPSESLITWATEFNQWVEAHTAAPRMLMGYSMGGRLALHALIQNPTLWQKATLISTNIGLKDPTSRLNRLKNDYKWAEKFRNDPWEKLMKDWESQSLFKGSFKPTRNEKDYNREDLALHLENFSLANQEYLLPDIAKLNLPIQWITGSLDHNAESQAKDVAANHSHSKHLSIPNGTHRVHFEFPESLSFILR